MYFHIHHALMRTYVISTAILEPDCIFQEVACRSLSRIMISLDDDQILLSHQLCTVSETLLTIMQSGPVTVKVVIVSSCENTSLQCFLYLQIVEALCCRHCITLSKRTSTCYLFSAEQNPRVGWKSCFPVMVVSVMLIELIVQ